MPAPSRWREWWRRKPKPFGAGQLRTGPMHSVWAVSQTVGMLLPRQLLRASVERSRHRVGMPLAGTSDEQQPSRLFEAVQRPGCPTAVDTPLARTLICGVVRGPERL
eukprot:364282-Chlamydomonas_euryale.AAC.44